MHTPAGAVLVDDSYQLGAWSDVLFNPSLPWYAGLFVLASALTVAFLMLGMVAAQSLRRPVDESGRLVFKTAIWIAAVGILLQGVMAAGTVNMMAQHQPAKAAATAAYWHSGASADRSEEHTSELQSLMRISYAVFCLKKKIVEQ